MYFSLLLIAVMLLPIASHADWSLWVVPEKREVKPYQALRFNFGVSGMGDQLPQDFKVTLYSDMDSQLHPLNENAKYEMYALTFKNDAPHDLFTKVDPKDRQGLIREIEGNTPFPSMFVIPESPGEKTVTLILSYRTSGDVWLTSSAQFHFYVTNWVERNQYWITVLAIVVGLVGLWKDALSGLLKHIRKAWKSNKKFKTKV